MRMRMMKMMMPHDDAEEDDDDLMVLITTLIVTALMIVVTAREAERDTILVILFTKGLELLAWPLRGCVPRGRVLHRRTALMSPAGNWGRVLETSKEPTHTPKP